MEVTKPQKRLLQLLRNNPTAILTRSGEIWLEGKEIAKFISDTVQPVISMGYVKKDCPRSTFSHNRVYKISESGLHAVRKRGHE